MSLFTSIALGVLIACLIWLFCMAFGQLIMWLVGKFIDKR